MGYYLRKSFRFGPVRLNLSKSGIGASFGVKGFRYGVRPNGSTYVHAGRHGLYYRQNLSPDSRPKQAPATASAVVSPSAQSPSTLHKTLTASELARLAGTRLVELLNRSRSFVHHDSLSALVIIVAIAFSFVIGPSFGSLGIAAAVVVAAGGLVAALLVFRWESRRRTVYAFYHLDGADSQAYQQLLNGLNALATSHRVWALHNPAQPQAHQCDSTDGGLSSLIGQRTIRVGSGTPRWLETNIDIPALLCRGQTFYFLPDGLLVHDHSGIAQLEYDALTLVTGITRCTGPSPPADATVVGSVWLHAKKDGGPDLRYSNNYQIPISLYGELLVHSPGGLLLYLQTSQKDAPEAFKAGITDMLSQLRRSGRSLRPTLEVNPEHFQSLPSYALDVASSMGPLVLNGVRRFDGLLKRISGGENHIVHGFLRCLVLVAVVALCLIGFLPLLNALN